MQQSRVAKVDFWRFYLALAQISIPGLQQAYHEQILKQIDIAAGCGFANIQCARCFGVIPYLPMVMGQQAPKSKQACGGDIETKLRDIPFKKSAHEILAPFKTGFFAGSRERHRKPTPSPELILRILAHFSQAETAHDEDR